MPPDFRADIGQLLWIGIDGPKLSRAETEWLQAGKAGVVVLFGRNLEMNSDGCDIDAVRDLNRMIHGISASDQVLVAVDQEGGRVQRIKQPLTKWPPMLRHDDLTDEVAEKTAEAVGHQLGTELGELDFDIDFAPVLDVHTRDDNPIIGDRAFSRKPERAAACALAFARGLSSSGILPCGKHYPGHGDTDTDSHLALPKLKHDMDRLERIELLPFYRAAKQKLPMLMTAHVVFSALDATKPATLAESAMQVLREKIGFEGVIVSDDLDMKAISDEYEVGGAGVMAVKAGCNALLLCRDKTNQHAVFDAMVKECEKSSGFREQVGQSAARVRQMRASHLESRSLLAKAEGAKAAAKSEIVQTFLSMA